MNRYERRLPHWDVIGQPIFVTFRLHGSLPANRVFPPARLTTGKAFVAMDRILDSARSGPVFLAHPQIACLMRGALEVGQTRFHRYELEAFVIMPNHVHLLLTPRVSARNWLGPLKGFTAHEANRILGRCGEPFWQDESYDHVVRTGGEFHRICAYIENNPVRAGLAKTPGVIPVVKRIPGAAWKAGGSQEWLSPLSCRSKNVETLDSLTLSVSRSKPSQFLSNSGPSTVSLRRRTFSIVIASGRCVDWVTSLHSRILARETTQQRFVNHT